MAILTIISAIASAIGGAVISAGTYFVEGMKLIWEAVWKMVSFFLDHAPKPLQIFVFLFLLVTIGNLFSQFFLGSVYACTSDDKLYQAENVFQGIGNRVRMAFFGFTISEQDSFINSNYDRIEQKADITNVRCDEGEAMLYFYSIDVFSYNLWLLLLILIYGGGMAIKYYQSSGLLH